MKHTASFHKGHPNPQFYREKYKLLDGKWNFSFDDESSEKLTINVPYSYGSTKSGILTREIHNKVIYKTTFKKPFDADKFILHFDGVDYISEVYLNGQFLGSHTGGYDAFKYVVNLKEDNELKVVVFDNLNVDTIRGKQTWRYSPFECFYFNTIGIWKSVWIEGVNNTYIDSVKFEPSYANKTLKISTNIIGEFDNVMLCINNDEYAIKDTTTLVIENPIKWSTNNPYLYDAIIKVYKDNKVIDEVSTYFGFNDVTISDKNVLLNGDKTFLKLILDQGYSKDGELTLTEDEIIKSIELMKLSGFNGARKHQKIEPELFYYYADVYGYLLWEELPSPHCYSAEMMNEVKRQMPRIINEHFNHPCVIANVIFNESWGIQDVDHYKEMSDQVTEMYSLIKKLVPNRIVISNDGWEHTKSDIISVHNYNRGYDLIKKFYVEEYAKLSSGENAKANDYKLTFVPNYKYNNEPYMLTEFGGMALSKDIANQNWGYGNSINNIQTFLDEYKALILAIKDSNVFSGFCYTQLNDVQQEVNGLLDDSFEPKFDLSLIKEINELL